MSALSGPGYIQYTVVPATSLILVVPCRQPLHPIVHSGFPAVLCLRIGSLILHHIFCLHRNGAIYCSPVLRRPACVHGIGNPVPFETGLHSRTKRPSFPLSQSKWRVECGVERESAAEQLRCQVEHRNTGASQLILYLPLQKALALTSSTGFPTHP